MAGDAASAAAPVVPTDREPSAPTSGPSLHLPTPGEHPAYSIILCTEGARDPAAIDAVISPASEPTDTYPPVYPAVTISVDAGTNSTVDYPGINVTDIEVILVIIRSTLFTMSIS